MQNNQIELEEVKKVNDTHEITTGVSVSIHDLKKDYGDRKVLLGVDLEIKPGEFVAIVGRSGCGKSTLLRLVAGIEKSTTGSLHLDHVYLPKC